jgi:hypothetical protein
MPRVVLKNGLLYPLEPLPAEWQDGQELHVECVESMSEPEFTVEEIERSFQELAALCEVGDPSDDERLRQALEEAHRLAKSAAR